MVKSSSDNHQKMHDDFKDTTLQIKEEQLDVVKEWIQTGEVNIYRDAFIEEKSFTIPVLREELVIEKKIFNLDGHEHIETPVETIRIPISEEKVEFMKHKVTLEDVSIYKERIEDIKHIEETLKREEAKIKIYGSPMVREESNPDKSGTSKTK